MPHPRPSTSVAKSMFGTFALVCSLWLLGCGSGVVQAATLVGAPTELGDAAAPAATQTLSIVTASLANATKGQMYVQPLLARGGSPRYRWAITAGSLPAGLEMDELTGIIYGTAKSDGTSTITAVVTDQGSPVQWQSRQFSLVVGAKTPAKPLSVDTSKLTNAKVGSVYAVTLAASGGTPAYVWNVLSGRLPDGLTLTKTGVLSGTPKTAGAHSFVATVSDAGSPPQRQNVSLSLTVDPAKDPLTIKTAALADAQTGASYSTKLQAAGGTPSYTWALASGSLPKGFTLAADGTLAGAVKTAGTFSFGVAVTDSGRPAERQTRQMSLTIAKAPLRVLSVSLPSGRVGGDYAAALLASGGTPRYRWSLASGSLPDGLSMDELTGVIYGTATKAGQYAMTATVSDQGAPAQTQSQALSIRIEGATTPLTASATGVGSAGAGKSYTGTLSASGGTPAYTWSISSGALPSGLSLAATTGMITGTPTNAGSFRFTASVKDNGSPAQTKTVDVALNVDPVGFNTWFVRPDGGTRFSSQVTDGQCDGLSDSPYPGKGVNQHCAFKDFRYLWDDKSGRVGAGSWVIAGGDTVLIRGCSAGRNQQNASDPNCRLGWDAATGTGDNLWCYGVGSYTCTNPAIPAGTADRHTRILGQNFATCAANGKTNPREYVQNLTQLFSGFSLQFALNLRDTKYVDIQCIELTTHNGRCVTSGSPQYPRPCNRDQPLDDYGLNGFGLNEKSSNILLQDVYIHGFNSSGLSGPIGGAVTMTRVYSGFNAFSGWNFDDGRNTPNAAGSSITAKYVTMIGNGCYEEYPVTHDFPAQACYDDQSGGFGDAWSGQDTDIDSFVCDHCVMAYNTKDAFIGPHTNVKNLTIVYSQSYGNMGAQWKWNNTVGATTLFSDNVTIGNCMRMNTLIPGAAHSFDQGSGLPGAYLSSYCRAGGNTVAINSQANSSVSFVNSTFINYLNTGFLLSCGPNNQNRNKACGNTAFSMTNNIFLGYRLKGGQAPGLIYIDDPSIKVAQKNNIQFGNRPGHGEVCGNDQNLCADPAFVNEPPQADWDDQRFLDNFNFHLSSSSPALGAGLNLVGMLTQDLFGVVRSAVPSIGAVEK